MAEVDSLEISIQSNIDKVNKNMDLLIKKMGIVAQGISAIGSNKGLEEFTKKAQSISSDMGKIGKSVSQSVKPIEEQVGKIAKTFEQVKEPFKDLGKGFKVSGGIADIQKSLQRYENELEKAKLKEQELSAKGMTDTKGYRDSVASVVKYQNVIESLKEQLKSVKELEAKKVEIPVKELGVEEFTTRIKKQIEQSLDGLRIENPISIGDMSHEQFQIFKTLNEEAKEARNSLSIADEELEEIGKTSAQTGNTIRNSAQSFKYSASAMEAVFGKEYATIENFQQIAEKFNVKSGGQLGAALSDSFRNAEASAESLKEKFSGLVVPEIKEDNLKKLQSALKREEEEIDRLRAKLSNEITMGRITESTDDKKFVKLSEQIALAEKRAEALRAKIAEVGEGGTKGKVESLGKSFAKVSRAGKTLSKSLSGIVNSLRKFAQGVVSVFGKIGKLTKSMLLLGHATKKSNGGFNVGLKTILKYGFGIRSLYVLVNKLRSAIKEGMKNLIQYSDQTNQSVSMLSSSMSQFKNASAAAFAPILNTIAPVLNQLIQLFIRATNAVNQFFSALTGHGTWIKAKYNFEDVADKISGAADAAKGALQPFDKLNNLTTQKGAGAGGIEPGDMFETVPVEDKFKDLADWLKDMWKNADFYDLGKKLGEKLKEALDSIPWDYIKEWARKLAHMLATFINGFIEVEGLGYSIGKTLAEAINTAYEFLNEFVHTLHWESIGHFIADTLNGFFENIDWELIRDTFVTGFKGLANAINQFIADFHWDNISNTISNAINIIVETVYTFFSTINWDELGRNLGEQLRKTIEKIDWEMVGRAIGSALQSAFDFVKSFLKEQDFTSIKNAISDLLKGFFEEVDTGDLAVAITAVIGAALAKISVKSLLAKFKTDLLAKSLAKAFGAAGAASGTSFWGSLSGALTSLGGIGGLLTTDIGTILGAGTFSEIGLAAGTALVGAFAGVFAGGVIGKLLNNYVLAPLFSFDEELSEQYKNFKFFGEDGFFATFKESLTDGSGKEALQMWGDDIYKAFVTLGERQEEAVQPIIEKVEDFKSLFSNGQFQSAVKLWGNDIYNAFVTLGERQSETLENIKSDIKSVGESIKEDWNESYMGQMISSFTDGSWQEAISLWGEDIKSSWTEIWGYVKEDWNNSIIGEVLGSFKDGTWKEALDLWAQDIKSSWENIKTDASQKWDDIKETIHGAIEKIKGFLKFEWSLPKIKLPHFKITGSFSINPPKVPSISVDWYAKGGLFKTANVVGVGEAGAEAVLPLTNKRTMGMIADSIMSQYNSYSENGYKTTIVDEYSSGTASELRQQNKLLQKQNELLQAILEKPNISDGEIYSSFQTSYQSQAKRKGVTALDPVLV